MRLPMLVSFGTIKYYSLLLSYILVVIPHPYELSKMSSKLQATFAECLEQVNSDSHEVQERALQALAYITKVSPQNRSLLAQKDGAISTVTGLLNSSSLTIQSVSLSILFNLSLNTNLKQSLADMKTIHNLNSIILSPKTSKTGKLAASLICSLAMLDKTKAVFGVAGTVQTIVKILGETRCDASHHLLSSLGELVQFHGNCTLAVRAGAVPVLIQIVDSTDGEDLAGTSLAVLGLLARYEEGISAIRNTDGVVHSMVDVLTGRCMLSKEGSAEILLRLFDENEQCLRDAARLPGFSSLLADLSVRGSARARESANLLMKKMMDANLDPGVDSNPMFSYAEANRMFLDY